MFFFSESFETGAASGASVVSFVFSMSKIYWNGGTGVCAALVCSYPKKHGASKPIPNNYIDPISLLIWVKENSVNKKWVKWVSCMLIFHLTRWFMFVWRALIFFHVQPFRMASPLVATTWRSWLWDWIVIQEGSFQKPGARCLVGAWWSGNAGGLLLL